VLEYAHLKTEEAPRVMLRHESTMLLYALELSETPANLLAVSWTFARGEFDGLRVERRARTAAKGMSVWL
jgi:hypothetical protein